MSAAETPAVEPGLDLGGRRLFGVLVAPAASAAAWRFFLPERPDQAGHFLAGFGGTLLLAWAVARLARGRSIGTLVATLFAVGLGAIAEDTLFRIGGFDPLDLFSQSLGAAEAGLALVLGFAGDPELDSPDDALPLLPNGFGRGILLAGTSALLLGGVFAFS